MQKITAKEAKKAAWEMVNEPDVDLLHLQELYDKLEEAVEENKEGRDSAKKK